jgi:lactoylglutathione lyase
MTQYSRTVLSVLAGACALAVAPVLIAAPARPHITGLSHVALYSHDLARSRAFYKDFFGYAEPYSAKNPDGSLRLTWIKINDRQQIEFFPEKEAGSNRLYQVAFITDDAVALRDYLAAKGVKVPDKVGKGTIGNLNFSVKDPDGQVIEFVQYLPDGRTRQNDGKDLPATRIAPRIRHAGIMVADLEASLKFYRDILGFSETWRGSSNDKVLSWVNVKVPDGDEYLELMLYDPATPPTTDRIRTMNHLCLEVDDVAAADRTLKARGLPAGCKPTTKLKTGRNGKRQINCYDPDGTRVEIMEPNTADGKPVPPSTAPPPGRKN